MSDLEQRQCDHGDTVPQAVRRVVSQDQCKIIRHVILLVTSPPSSYVTTVGTAQ